MHVASYKDIIQKILMRGNIHWPEFSQHRNTLRLVAWMHTTGVTAKFLSTFCDAVECGMFGSMRKTRLATVSRDDKTDGDDSSWTLSTISSHDLWSATLFTCNHKHTQVIKQHIEHNQLAWPVINHAVYLQSQAHASN